MSDIENSTKNFEQQKKITNKYKKTEEQKKTDEHKVLTKPCWYILNNFQCFNENCKFSHTDKLINEHKQKREKELCRQFKKCEEKCNKYHNVFEIMDLYKETSNKLDIIKGIIKN